MLEGFWFMRKVPFACAFALFMIFFAAASQAQDKIDRFSAVTTVRHSLGMGSISIATYSGHKFPDPVGLAICACALRQRA